MMRIDVESALGIVLKNISRIRRFAIGVIKTVSQQGVAETMRDLTMNVRLVFDYLKMTRNSMSAMRMR